MKRLKKGSDEAFVTGAAGLILFDPNPIASNDTADGRQQNRESREIDHPSSD
jgi:hypothetical protein